MRSNATCERITGPGIVIIVRLPTTEGLDRVAEAAIRGGAGALEVTMNTPGALEWLRAAGDRFGDQLLLGSGTVLEASQAEQALDAGARFIVAPDFNADVVAATKRAGALAVPGAYTASEIMAAWRAGADLVKVFPASLGGPGYIADLVAPLDQVLLVPTGGVDEENAAAFIRAGAAAVAIGGRVVNARAIAEGRFDEMAERIRRVVESVAEGRSVAAPAAVGV